MKEDFNWKFIIYGPNRKEVERTIFFLDYFFFFFNVLSSFLFVPHL